ncbi:hypothetical protein DY000_02052740 [Brassica cretica]|uniref:Uncharacterized protein n=1 Tax=Brassica cretica TaxID=69181 RepID=A0ABQ7AA76_BRACR|nr:hypothetical protein DY000_02052740 [Brassica cretica]
MDFGRTSIDGVRAISSVMSTEISVDDARRTSIDNTPPKAGKYSLIEDANEIVVLGEPKGQLSNANNQIMNEHGTAIHVQIKSISERDNEWKLPLQDYLNPGRTYSNRSAIRLPKDDTKKFGISPEYLIMVRQNPFRGTVSERLHDHIEIFKVENMDFGRTSIDGVRAISSVMSTEISVDDARRTSIDNTPPKAGKYSLIEDANEIVVLGEPKGQLSNANNQIMNEHGTAIHVQIKSISERDNEWKLPLQDYLNPGRTYSNRSAIRLPKDDTKKFGISPEYLIMVRQNPFRGTVSERLHDHIEYLEELMDDEYNR